MLSCFSHVRLFETPWTVACEAPLPIGFSKQVDWRRLPMPSSRGSSQPKDRTASLGSPVLAGGFFTSTPFQGLKKITLQKQSGPFDSVSLYFSPLASSYNSKIPKIYASGLNTSQYLEVFLLSHSLNRSYEGKISPTSQCFPITCCAIVQSCLTLYNHMDCSTPEFPVLHHLPELAQTHVH